MLIWVLCSELICELACVEWCLNILLWVWCGSCVWKVLLQSQDFSLRGFWTCRPEFTQQHCCKDFPNPKPKDPTNQQRLSQTTIWEQIWKISSRLNICYCQLWVRQPFNKLPPIKTGTPWMKGGVKTERVKSTVQPEKIACRALVWNPSWWKIL